MKKLSTLLIYIYQKTISPTHGTFKEYLKRMGVGCRYYPSCSEYTKQAILQQGVKKGIFSGVKRIIRCNPYYKGGYDPVNQTK